MKYILLVSCLFIFISTSLAQESSQSKTDVQEEETGPKPIAIPDVPTSADEIYQVLTKISSESQPSADIQSIEKELPEYIDSLNVIRSNPIYKSLPEQTVRMLQNLKQEWDIYSKQLQNWKKALVPRAQSLEKKSSDIKSLREIWKLTGQLAKDEKAPKTIRDRIASVMKQISETESEVTKRLNIVLDLQNQLSKLQIEINELTDKIKKTESEKRGSLFVIDSPSLWEMLSQPPDSLNITSQFEKSWSEMIRANVTFVKSYEDRFYVHVIIYIALIMLMLFLNYKNKQDNLFDENEKSLKASAHFISRPISAASLIALMLSIWIYPETTTTVAEFLLLLILFPLIRLLPGIFQLYMRRAVYILFILFFIDLVQKNAIGFILFQRIVLLIITITLTATLVWLIKTQKDLSKKQFFSKSSNSWISIFALVLLVVSLIGNVIGSVSLSRTFTIGIIESSYILVTLYISASVFSGLITVLIRQRRQKALQFVTTFGDKLERWARSFIYIVAFYLWGRATLRSFGLFDDVSEWFKESLEHTWKVGTLEISVNAIFDFIVILIATFIIIRLIRAFMDLEIFPRLNLPKGLPAAISMMVRYILIGLGIFIALSALGMDLGKFGILAGALGVGLGFGLQKIVANFISSLIIAFNRLIRVGDTVKYGDTMGNVTDVGVNASTVRTFDGSEVLIPNADLISYKVTNWTLSDNKRRMQMPVKVAYGSDPHVVIELLVKVAKYHPEVFQDPEPFAIFNGFQEHFLDFTLYYWIPTSAYFPAKNEIALSVHDILKLNKIDTPRPWRDIKVEMDEKSQDNPPAPKKPAARKKTTRK